jgi:hypothetical protein
VWCVLHLYLQNCFGAKAYGHGRCVQDECMCCKQAEDDSVFCVCHRSMSQCVSCALYDVYEQIFCVQCIFSCCCNL